MTWTPEVGGSWVVSSWLFKCSMVFSLNVCLNEPFSGLSEGRLIVADHVHDPTGYAALRKSFARIAMVHVLF